MDLLRKIISIVLGAIMAIPGYILPLNGTANADVETLYKTKNITLSSGESIIIETDFPIETNTLILREKGDSAKFFTFEAFVDGDFKLVTKGDTIDEYRFCAFDSVTSDKFRLTINDCGDKEVKLRSIELCLDNNKAENFKVTSYYVVRGNEETVYLDEGHYKTITDLIVFGAATFDENGDLSFDGKNKVSVYMDRVRKINPDIKIHLNILGPDAPGETWDEQMINKGALHVKAMKDNSEKLINNIVTVLNEMNFDGIYFDWEYTTTVDLKYEFSVFLVKLDEALGNKELGSALSAWCCKLSKNAIKCLDNVTIMCYDIFDRYGYHASFSSAYDGVRDFLKAGYSKEQLQLGLAFYARPLDAGGYWFEYSTYADKLGKYTNTLDVEYNGQIFPSYFNSPQITRDKTAYAIASDLAGVMIWNHGCDLPFDNELSLYRAITEAIK